MREAAEAPDYGVRRGLAEHLGCSHRSHTSTLIHTLYTLMQHLSSLHRSFCSSLGFTAARLNQHSDMMQQTHPATSSQRALHIAHTEGLFQEGAYAIHRTTSGATCLCSTFYIPCCQEASAQSLRNVLMSSFS